MELTDIQEKTTGWDQNVWICNTTTNSVVVKMPKEDAQLYITREKLACQLLEKKKLIVPKILYSNDKILIESCIEGNPLDEADFSHLSKSKIYEKCGQTLQKIHEISGNGFGEVSDETLTGEYQYPLTEIKLYRNNLEYMKKKHYFSDNIINGMIDYYENEMDTISQSKSMLLHSDFGDSNIILTNSGEIGVVDFGDLSVGNPMQDLFCQYIDHYQTDTFTSFLNVYGEHDIQQINYFAFCRLTFLVPFLKENSRKDHRVPYLSNVLKKIWKIDH